MFISSICLCHHAITWWHVVPIHWRPVIIDGFRVYAIMPAPSLYCGCSASSTGGQSGHLHQKYFASTPCSRISKVFGNRLIFSAPIEAATNQKCAVITCVMAPSCKRSGVCTFMRLHTHASSSCTFSSRKPIWRLSCSLLCASVPA